jgi:hypothetical protein
LFGLKSRGSSLLAFTDIVIVLLETNVAGWFVINVKAGLKVIIGIIYKEGDDV